MAAERFGFVVKNRERFFLRFPQLLYDLPVVWISDRHPSMPVAQTLDPVSDGVDHFFPIADPKMVTAVNRVAVITKATI